MPTSPAMLRLKRAVAARRRWSEEVNSAILAAVDAGEKQTEIADVAGRSREHVRLLLKARAEGKATSD